MAKSCDHCHRLNVLYFPFSETIPKTNAEIQADFRRRSELVRLDIRIEGIAKRALVRLAAHHGMTQSAMLNELILKAEREVHATLNTSEREAYTDCKPITR